MRNFKSQNILCAEAELRDLKSKLLYGSGTAKLPSHSMFLVRKQNCAISELQVTLFCMRKRNLKSQYIPCAEAERQAKEYCYA